MYHKANAKKYGCGKFVSIPLSDVLPAVLATVPMQPSKLMFDPWINLYFADPHKIYGKILLANHLTQTKAQTHCIARNNGFAKFERRSRTLSLALYI